MLLKPQIFRQYDIRGIVGEDLTPESVRRLGLGIGSYLRRRDCRQVAVGGDCRLSSPEFADALSDGLTSVGCDVVSLGTIPTPLLYYSIFAENLESGVMITGSHNPPEFNGFKLMAGKETLFGPDIQDIRRLIESEDWVTGEKGRITSLDIVPRYHREVVSRIRLDRPLKVVVDAGNGTGGAVAVPILRELGNEVIELYCEMDGRFPNHHPDPTLPEALQDLIAKVAETGADLGIAYDGDADRIGVIDDRGQIIWGDRLMVLFSRDILPAHPGAAVISEVKASQVLYDEIEKLGGRPIMWKTGHSFIKKKIKEEKALLAGEMSGHIFFADRWYGFDDAIYSSARLLEILARGRAPLSRMLADLPTLQTTPEIRFYASDEVKFRIVDGVRRELEKRLPVISIDGVRALYPFGWALVRASNTQGSLVLRFEADTAAHLEQMRKEVEGVIKSVIEKLENGKPS
jgi:phosphomannomutase/phosphoglucomutase